MVFVVAFCVALLAFAQSAVAQTVVAEQSLEPTRVRTISITPPVAQSPIAQKPAPQKLAQQPVPQKVAQPAGHLDGLVAKHAAAHGVPKSLVHRVIKIESGGNPRLVSKGNHGLMQIRLGTARSMGYSGDSSGLLDADTNMTYAVKYLAGAYRAAGGNSDRAVSMYQRGYYQEAKAQGFSPYARQAKQAPVLAPVLVSVEPAAMPQARMEPRAKPEPEPQPQLEPAPAPVAARKADRLETPKPDQHAALQAEPAPPVSVRRARSRRVQEQPRSLFADLKAEIAHAQEPTGQPARRSERIRSDRMMAAAPQAEPVQQRTRASKPGKPFDLSVFVKQFVDQDKQSSRRRAQPQTPSQPPS